jgi:hypothetical protein
MNRKFFISIFFLFAIANSVYAQEISKDYYIRKINLRALDLLNDYQNYCNCASEESITYFKNLFSDSAVLVANDILPDNNLNEKINLEDYVFLINKYYSQEISYTVIPIAISPITYISTFNGSVNIDAIKIISGNTKKQFNYNDTLKLKFSIVFNYLNKSYKISDINQLENKGKYCIISANKKTPFSLTPIVSDTLILNNSKIALDERGYYIYKNLSDKDQIVIRTNDINIPGEKRINATDIGLKPNQVDKNIVAVNFKIPFLTIQPVYKFIPFKASPLKYVGSEFNFSLLNNYSYSGGIRIGFLIKNSSKGYFQIKTGVHLFNYDYNISLNEFSKTVLAVDADQGAYIRTNFLTGITEKNSLQQLAIPLVFEKGFNINKNNLIYLCAGGYLIPSSTLKYDGSAQALYKGNYKDLYNITISENGVYDFGTFQISSQKTIKTSTPEFSIEAATGYSRRINSRIMVNAGFSYYRSISLVFNNLKDNLSNDYSELNSLTNLSNQFILNFFTLDFGLTIKI